MLIYSDHNGVKVYKMDDTGVYSVSDSNGAGLAKFSFQSGTVKDFGINGITNESLLAIVANRIRALNSGQFSCRENSIALTKVEEALLWLEARTKDRINRGVEGKDAA